MFIAAFMSLSWREPHSGHPLPIVKRKIFVSISAVATRFCCSSPLTDLTEGSLMFETFELQYLNKLIESKVGDFPSPQAFHSCQVQRFKSKCLKTLHICFANPCVGESWLPDSTPPVIRTFLFSRKTLIEGAELFQRCRNCGDSIFSLSVKKASFIPKSHKIEVSSGEDTDEIWMYRKISVLVKRNRLRLNFRC